MSGTKERPLLTLKVMEGFISMRLRPNEGPRHIDALCAARDFYENRIDRDYVFRSLARAEVIALMEAIQEMRQYLKDCPDALVHKVDDVLMRADSAFIKINPKGK